MSEKKQREKKMVYAVYPCLGCMPSSIKMMGYRACGHKKDTTLKAPLFNL